MERINGVSSVNSISSSFDVLTRQRWLAIALLLCAGATIALMHDVFRFPLKMPGRHGLELFAILIFARCMSNRAYAGFTVGVGNAGMVMLLDHAMSFEPLIFVLQGLILDSTFDKARSSKYWVFTLALLAALLHGLKPLVNWIVDGSFAGIQHGSLVNGLAYPFAWHLVFGFVGGLAGAMAWKAMQKQRKQ